MILGKFNIEDYEVAISGVTETRQRITYYDLENNELFKARYYGDTDEINEGYVMDDGTPRRVQRWQFKSQLDLEPSPDSGYTSLKEYTTYLIDQLSGTTKIISTEAWDSANYVSYYSPTVSYIATMAGLNDSDVRRIFRDASNIEV